METFNLYAHYYNLLYRDKSYAQESEYVWSRLSEFGAVSNLLNAGCGTGNHDRWFAEKGIMVHGFDLSPEMIAKAKEHGGGDLGKLLDYHVGDFRTFRLGHTVDAVISLFHVMSYQNETRDLVASIQTAAAHLKSGGLFAFDCWNGSGVLTDPPHVRVRRLEDDRVKITRLAEPFFRCNDNVVEVHYEVHVEDKRTGARQTIMEKHPMRYLFYPEMEHLLKESGFEILCYETWMTGAPVELGTWNSFYVCRKA